MFKDNSHIYSVFFIGQKYRKEIKKHAVEKVNLSNLHLSRAELIETNRLEEDAKTPLVEQKINSHSANVMESRRHDPLKLPKGEGPHENDPS